MPAVISLLMTGNTLPRLQLGDIQELQIPVPPVPMQEKIATHALRRQAAAELSAAKNSIEAMILGKAGQP